MAGDACRPGEQLLGDGPGGDACGGFPRARAFEDVAHVVAAVLGHARQIGVAGTRTRDGSAARAATLDNGRVICRGFWGNAHRVLPVRPITVLDHHRDRAADRLARADAGEELGAVGFDRHAAAASVPALTPSQVAGDGVEVNERGRLESLRG